MDRCCRLVKSVGGRRRDRPCQPMCSASSTMIPSAQRSSSPTSSAPRARRPATTASMSRRQVRHGGYLVCSPARAGCRPRPTAYGISTARVVHGRPGSKTSRSLPGRRRAHDAVHPATLDRPVSLQLESKFDEEPGCSREVVHHDADVLHPLDRHVLYGNESSSSHNARRAPSRSQVLAMASSGCCDPG